MGHQPAKAVQPVKPVKAELTKKQWNQFGEQAKTLSEQERNVAKLIAMGMGSKDICEKMNITAKTLDIHRGNVKKKFGLDAATAIPLAFLAGAGLIGPCTV